MMLVTLPLKVETLPLVDSVRPPYSSARPSSQGTLPLLATEVEPDAPEGAVVCWSVLFSAMDAVEANRQIAFMPPKAK